ncbi:MAG: 2TM domain-containing protein [Candidatus Atelocyanobacterium thalassa]|uniref:2TM domain n=1 Tax=Candidatus Atelocyanobacterium thalassa isolate SIO64986 TaxID=1527444 RepID=A0A086CFN4_9CHRO|nr:MAG: 2TM domain [Candidatus Atelocyanobacterium thalassa isolate SIO64986]
MLSNNILPPTHYHKTEVQEILHLAIVSKTKSEEISREEFLEIALELGISIKSLEIVEQNWLSTKKYKEKQQEFDKYLQKRLKHKIIKFLIINSFCVILNFLAVHTLSWSLYVLTISGLIITLDIFKTFQSESESYQKEFQKWSLTNEIKTKISGFWSRLTRRILS